MFTPRYEFLNTVVKDGKKRWQQWRKIAGGQSEKMNRQELWELDDDKTIISFKDGVSPVEYKHAHILHVSNYRPSRSKS